MNSNEMAQLAVKVLDEKKAKDIKALKVSELTVITDYFIIASGGSSTQVRALCDELEKVFSEKGVLPKHIEGMQSLSWVLMDFGDVIVHIFNDETREFYGIERLWQDAEEMKL